MRSWKLSANDLMKFARLKGRGVGAWNQIKQIKFLYFNILIEI